MNGSEVAAAIDAALTEQVLVVGSPPPTGRDLDLLARDRAFVEIAQWLGNAGFLPARTSWVRFDGPSPYNVDLSSPGGWMSESYDPARLFRDAEPLPGYRHLVHPGPATVVLLAARGVAARQGVLTKKSRARVGAALQRDPGAWVSAEREARHLGLAGAVHLLRRAYEAAQPLSLPARAGGMVGLLMHGGPAFATARAFFQARPRYARPLVVSFSGLDGAGKSTQVTGLRETFDQLGFTATVQWAGFATAWRVRAALDTLLPERTTSGAPHARDPLMPVEPRLLRQHAWVFTVALVNAINLWRHLLRPRRGTEVVIFDRFSPDTAVKLDYHYGHIRSLNIPWQRALFKLVCPKPDIGFLLAVPSETSWNRRGEWDPETLAMMEHMYLDQARRFGLIRLDGTEPAAALTRRVATAAWQGMR